MTHVPSWWEFALLALAAYRLWRLISKDTITEPIRSALSMPDSTAITLDMPLTIAPNLPEDERPKPRIVYVATLLRCAWCAGFYISVGVWAAWFFWPHVVVVAAVPVALSAAVGLVGKLDR